MIKINLLPRKHTKKKLTVIRHLVISGAILAVALGAMGYFTVSLGNKVDDLTRKIADANKEKESLKNVNQEKEQHQKTIDGLKHRIDVITQIEKGRTVPLHLFDEVTRALDETMPLWLTRLTYTKNVVQIEGYSFTNPELSRFLQRLENSPYIQSVNLTISQKIQQQGKDVYRFAVNAELEVS